MSFSSVIHGYEILELIGQGGMGEVFKAQNLQTKQTVAIKSLKQEILLRDPQNLERFQREGEMLAQLNHPNIVKVLDSFEEGGVYYIVMEYVSGGTLAELLDKSTTLPLARVLQIALDLADALTRAHRLKIIHRDIKPANVLIADDGTPRLTDFGIARMGDSKRLTQTGAIVGTYAYLSPEAVNGEVLDSRSDVWSFGVMLYEMLTGKRPFEKGQEAATLMAVLRDPMPDIVELRPDVPNSLVNLINLMLEKDKEKRISSVRQIGAILENLIENLDSDIRNEIPMFKPGAVNTRFGNTPTPGYLSDPETVSPFFEPTPTPLALSTKTTILPPTPAPTAITAPAVPNRSKLWIAGGIIALIAVIAAVALLASGGGGGDETNEVAATATPSIVVVDPVQPGEFMIMVAQLEPLGSETRDVNRFLTENLRQVIEDGAPQTRAIIRDYPGIVRSEDEALEIAQANNAPVIVWGNYTDDLIEIEMQIASITSEIYSEKTLTDTGRVRLHLTNERQESVAIPVLGALWLWQTLQDDTYSAATTLVISDGLDVQPAEIMGSSVGAHTHRYFSLFFDEPDQAVQEVTDALVIDSSNPMLYHLRAILRSRIGEFDTARQDFQTAIRLTSEKSPAILLAAANNELQAGDQDAALVLFDKVIALDSNDWFALTLRGGLHYLRGDFERAKADYEAAIALNPQNNFPYVFSSIIALREGRVSDVIDLMNIVLTRFPDPTFANRIVLTMSGGMESGNNIYGLALGAFTNMTLGQYAEAIANAEAGLALENPLVDFYLIEGIAHCNLDEYPEAEAAYTAGIERDPDYMILYLLRAEARSKQQNLAGALEDFAVAQDSDIWQEVEPLMAGGTSGLDCKSFFAAAS